MAQKITDILFSITAFGAGILSLLKEGYWPVGITLIIGGFILIYFSSYTSQIDKNTEDIKKLGERLIIYERLSKLEAKVFK